MILAVNILFIEDHIKDIYRFCSSKLKEKMTNFMDDLGLFITLKIECQVYVSSFFGHTYVLLTVTFIHKFSIEQKFNNIL